MNIQQITDEICNGVKSILGSHLQSLLFYGSYARKDYDEESDMDIMALVDLNHSEITEYRQQLNRLASRIGLEYDIMISLCVMNVHTVLSNADVVPYYRNVLKEGVNLIAG